MKRREFTRRTCPALVLSIIGSTLLDSCDNAKEEAAVIVPQEEKDYLARKKTIGAKGYLQEILQAIQPAAPDYQIISQTGPEHSKIFICCVVWNALELGQGQGSSKKEAQVAAAQVALEKRLWEGLEQPRSPRRKKKKKK